MTSNVLTETRCHQTTQNLSKGELTWNTPRDISKSYSMDRYSIHLFSSFQVFNTTIHQKKPHLHAADSADLIPSAVYVLGLLNKSSKRSKFTNGSFMFYAYFSVFRLQMQTKLPLEKSNRMYIEVNVSAFTYRAVS